MRYCAHMCVCVHVSVAQAQRGRAYEKPVPLTKESVLARLTEDLLEEVCALERLSHEPAGLPLCSHACVCSAVFAWTCWSAQR
jgi:hypothetical protein